MDPIGSWTPLEDGPRTAWASGAQWIVREGPADGDGRVGVLTLLAYPSPTNAQSLQDEIKLHKTVMDKWRYYAASSSTK